MDLKNVRSIVNEMSLVDELREMDGEEATCGWRTSSWNWLDFPGFWLVLSYVQKYNMHLFPKIFSKFYFSRINNPPPSSDDCTNRFLL